MVAWCYAAIPLHKRHRYYWYVITYCVVLWGGPAAAAPPPFRPGNPALCGSHPLVTPYYCRLGICCVLCLLCPCIFSVNCVTILCPPSVLWYCWLGLLTCRNCRPYNLYCVGGDVKHWSLNQSVIIHAGCHFKEASWNDIWRVIECVSRFLTAHQHN